MRFSFLARGLRPNFLLNLKTECMNQLSWLQGNVFQNVFHNVKIEYELVFQIKHAETNIE